MLILLLISIVFPLFLSGIFLLFSRKWKIGVCVIIISIVANICCQLFPLDVISFCKSNNYNSIRVLTYNVHASGDYFQHGKDSLFFLFGYFNDLNADMICFQEYDRGLDKAKLAQFLNNKYPYHSCLFDAQIGTYDPIYSKYPIRNFRVFMQPNRMQVFGMEILVNGKWVYLVNCHLTSNKYTVARDSMKTDDSWISGIPQYYEYLKKGYARRSVEADVIADSVRAHSDMPVLVCGDFNDVSGSYALRTIQKSKDLKDAWWTGGCGFGWTYDAHHLKLRLDHILYSDEFELKSVSVPHVKFSDHYPVVADFVIK